MTRKRHDNPNREEHNRKARPTRALERTTARVIYLQRLAKELEIGPDPKYDHSRGRNEMEWLGERQRWQYLSAEYDKRNAAE
jgi:hypothetical protein